MSEWRRQKSDHYGPPTPYKPSVVDCFTGPNDAVEQMIANTNPAEHDPSPAAAGVVYQNSSRGTGATSDGWRRREINVKQGSDGYPAIRDVIHLIDSSGAKYSGLPFIKGARHPGHTCLGQPGALKVWFTRHYSFEKVESVNVYFKPTGQPSEYRICTETEWKRA